MHDTPTGQQIYCMITFETNWYDPQLLQSMMPSAHGNNTHQLVTNIGYQFHSCPFRPISHLTQFRSFLVLAALNMLTKTPDFIQNFFDFPLQRQQLF